MGGPENAGGRYSRRSERQQYVIDRLHETKNGEVHATAALPDGSVKVWAEGDTSRPPTNREKFEAGWEQTFRSGT